MADVANHGRALPERFGGKAREIVENARTLARVDKERETSPEHLLKALLEAGECRGNFVLMNLGHLPSELRQRLTEECADKRQGLSSEEADLSDASRSVLLAAELRSRELGHECVDTDHLLLALRGVKATRASAFFRRQRISLDEITEDLLNLRGDGAPPHARTL